MINELNSSSDTHNKSTMDRTGEVAIEKEREGERTDHLGQSEEHNKDSQKNVS